MPTIIGFYITPEILNQKINNKLNFTGPMTKINQLFTQIIKFVINFNIIRLMRVVVFMTFMLSSVSCIITERVPGSETGDNIIVIQTQDPPDVAYRKIGQILHNNGFMIMNSDRELGSISTDKKNIGMISSEWALKVSVLITGNENAVIDLRGQTNRDNESAWRPLENKGVSGTINQLGWNELYTLASQYENATIVFDRK
jgi:hypothetical protein